MKKRALRKLVRSGVEFLVPVKDRQDANRVLMKLRAVGVTDDYSWNRGMYQYVSCAYQHWVFVYGSKPQAEIHNHDCSCSTVVRL